MANNRKVYSFKSAGQLEEDAYQQSLETLVTDPIGILTPVQFSKSDGNMFNMSTDVVDQIRDNLKNLVLTNKGERLMLHDFGANLRAYVFELSNDDVAAKAIRQISKTVEKYMPFVELEDFETRIQNSDNGETVGVTIRITYSVPSIGATNQAVEAIIYVAG